MKFVLSILKSFWKKELINHNKLKIFDWYTINDTCQSSRNTDFLEKKEKKTEKMFFNEFGKLRKTSSTFKRFSTFSVSCHHYKLLLFWATMFSIIIL